MRILNFQMRNVVKVLVVCFVVATVFSACEKDNGEKDNRKNNNENSNSGGGSGENNNSNNNNNNNNIVTVAPIANFTYYPSKPIAPCRITFTSTSSGDPTNYQWEFGNGQTATKDGFYLTVNEAGIYPVKLTVSNSAGSNSITKNVKVYDDCEANEYGYIKFNSTSKYSFDIYIDGVFQERIASNSSVTYKLSADSYSCKVKQVSGYIFSPTIEEKTITVNSCYVTTWTFTH